VCELQHAFEVCGVLLHLEVFERNVPPGVILTGGFRVGSGVFAEDQDWHLHDLTLLESQLEAGISAPSERSESRGGRRWGWGPSANKNL
jgi:hypothetical protein